MPLVRTQQIQRAVAIGENHDRGIGQSDPEIGIAVHDATGVAEILRRERLELIDTADDFVDEIQLCLVADAAANQVVQLREHKRRHNSWRGRSDQRRHGPAMQGFIRIEDGVQAARVEHDHREPNPSSA